MKKKPSKKHHYLPRYYLRGFTNNKGSFFVYDKQADRIFNARPGTDFVMLSGETAVGNYPVESVRMMNQIIKFTESRAGSIRVANGTGRNRPGKEVNP